MSEVLSQLETLQAELRQERKESKAKDRKIARLQEKLNFANWYSRARGSLPNNNL